MVICLLNTALCWVCSLLHTVMSDPERGVVGIWQFSKSITGTGKLLASIPDAEVFEYDISSFSVLSAPTI